MAATALMAVATVTMLATARSRRYLSMARSNSSGMAMVARFVYEFYTRWWCITPQTNPAYSHISRLRATSSA